MSLALFRLLEPLKGVDVLLAVTPPSLPEVEQGDFPDLGWRRVCSVTAGSLPSS